MRIIISLIITFFSVNAFSQISFYVEEDVSFPDISVKIGENISFPDIKVQIGNNISFDDFTVGLTSSRLRADFVIVDSKHRADKTVRAAKDASFPDISIQASENESFPDVKIEIKKSGFADYLIYTEKTSVSVNDFVIALLPVINMHLDYKFKDIPAYVEGYTNSQSANHQYRELINLVRGASIIAQDASKTFLGSITNKFNSNSIFNDSGTYGSDMSSYSIWNDIGIFGNDISAYSAFNDITSTPPMIVKNGETIGYLTVNDMVSDAISPQILKALKDEF